MQAGDNDAVEYFKGQIAKGEAMPAVEAPSVPQGGSILSPIAQGLSMGWADEAGGALSGALAKMRGEDFTPAYEKTRDSYREAADQYAQRHPYISTATELGSGLLLPGGALKSLGRVGGLAAGALGGAITGAGKNENPDSLTTDVALGGGLGGAGGAVAQGLGGLYRAIVPRVAARARGPAFQADTRALEAAGIPVTAAERIGSPGARAAEKQTAAYLNTGEEVATRPNILRSQIMARGGFHPEDVAAGELSDKALSWAKTRFKLSYDNVLRNARVDLKDMDPALNTIEQRFFGQMLDHEQKAEVRNIIDSFRDQITHAQHAQGGGQGLLSGEHYKTLRSQLGKRATQLARQEGPNSAYAPLYRDIQGALDDAFRTSARPGVAQRLRGIDNQYKHYAFLRDVAQDPDNINAIANRVNRSNVDPDLKALTRAYQNVIVRGGGQGAAEASGGLAPPVLSMAKALGARAAAGGGGSPFRLPGPLQRLTEGKKSFAFGQGMGITGQQMAETGNDAKRKARRRKEYDEHTGAGDGY